MPNSTPNIPDTGAEKSLHDWVWRRAVNLRTLDETLQIEKDRDRHNLVSRLVKRVQDLALPNQNNNGDPATPTKATEPVGGVDTGTTYSFDSPVSHYHAAPAPSPLARIMPWIGAALTGAGLVAGGVAASKLLPASQINVPPGSSVTTETKTGFLIDLVE